MKRAIRIEQAAPRPVGCSFALVPFGLYLNKSLQKASPGAIIEFAADWRRDKFVLLRKATLKVNSSVFSLLLKSIYGEDATWQKLSELWQAQCIVEGLGSRAFDTENVLLLSVKPFVKEEYEAELERIRRERILSEMEAARAQMLENARKGVFNHPDIIS